MTVDTVGELDVALDRVVWQVEEGEFDGAEALALLDDYRERIASEVE